MEPISLGQGIELTTKIVASYLEINTVQANDLPTLISTVHQSLKTLGQSVEQDEAPVDQKPAVSIKKSVQANHITCLECGKKLKMAKKHLLSNHGLTSNDYKKKWGLPDDYPLVSPNYAKIRSDYAHKIGLGKRLAD